VSIAFLGVRFAYESALQNTRERSRGFESRPLRQCSRVKATLDGREADQLSNGQNVVVRDGQDQAEPCACIRQQAQSDSVITARPALDVAGSPVNLKQFARISRYRIENNEFFSADDDRKNLWRYVVTRWTESGPIACSSYNGSVIF